MTRNTATETAWRQHEGFFTAGDGTRIGFSDTGNRKAPTTVLFLHGWTQNREAWDDVAGPLHERDPSCASSRSTTVDTASPTPLPRAQSTFVNSPRMLPTSSTPRFPPGRS